MRSILRFDLPVETAAQRKEYRQFVKQIKKRGFIRFQESVYVKLSINEAAVKNVDRTLRSHLPSGGMIARMTVTEKQFSGVNYYVGKFTSDVLNSDDRFIEL